jgi:NAD(P)-dependent dehydrogenase (short-subunit alcohol dehydrogenase family)
MGEMVSNAAYLQELFALDGRVALVTGASSGIGRELARGLANAGARVALSGRSTERLAAVQEAIAREGGEAEAFPAELGDLAVVKRLVADVAERFGRVDILVNCAGMNQREPVAEVQPDTYARIMDVNLRSPYFLSQAALPHFQARGGGKIVNIGSLTTSYGIGNISVYGLTKSAIGQMTRVMAVEWAEQNIQVNCICPGWIETELTKPLWADPHKRGWILDRVPVRRPGKPHDLVGMTIYLASPASDFTTGQTFYIDGGFMAGGQW